MNILVDGFKVIKQNNSDVVLFDYQVNSNNNVTICDIELGEKRNKFLCCYQGTNTILEAIHKKDFYNGFTSVQIKRALKLAKIKRKELLSKNVVMIKGY